MDASSESTPDLLQVKEFVVEVAYEVGRWAKQRHDQHHAGTREFHVSVKTVPGDVVTEVDVESQRRIATLLQERYPGFGLLGEEGLDVAADPLAPLWVIDPIDGTHNFVRGYPSFCVSIGLVRNGKSVLGVIYDAGQDTVYWAVEGQGAWRGQQRLSIPPTPLANAMVTTNFTEASIGNAGHRDFFVAISQASAGVRASGSACLDFCFVADGRVDLFWQFGLRAWDIAAGMALVQEAGGVVRLIGAPGDWLRGGPVDLVAGSGPLVDEALALGLPLLG